MNRASKAASYFSPIAGILAILATFGTTYTTAQETHDKEALEYDYCGSIVPATLPHLYQYAFRQMKNLKNRPKYIEAARHTLKWRLDMTDAEFDLFEDSAIRFNTKVKDMNQRIAAISHADREQHPERQGSLTEGARRETRVIIREREQVLSEEVDSLRAHFKAKRLKALDERITSFYANGTIIPASAPRAAAPCPIPDDSATEGSGSVN